MEHYDQQNLIDCEQEWLKSQKHLSIHEWAEIFPEAKTTIQEKIKECLLEIKDINERIASSVAYYQNDPAAEPICLSAIGINFRELYQQERLLKRLDYEFLCLDRNLPERERVDIEALKNRIDLREVAEKYGVKFTSRRGKNWIGKCPFHGEDKHPSFEVSQRLFWCFSCQKKGDVISFIQEKENIGFVEALDRIK